MKGEFTHPRTILMLEIALMNANAQFERNCGARESARCMIYRGSVWNRGTHLTVVVDRCLCKEHASGPAFAAVETWVYDISGESPVRMGRADLPQNVELLQEPGDVQEEPAPSQTFLKH